jgi:hypothetical protein
MYLLDTNAVIDYLEAGLPVVGMQFIGKIVDDNSNVSVITKMSLLRQPVFEKRQKKTTS